MQFFFVYIYIYIFTGYIAGKNKLILNSWNINFVSGSRFALLEVKTLLYNFVLNFKIVKCEKTVDPIKLVPHEFNICIKGGSWVKLEHRT